LWINPVMDGRASWRSIFSKTMSVALIIGVATAACDGLVAPEDGVASVEQGIRGGTKMGTGGIGFAVKVNQTMSDGKQLLCSGAFITPHVVLTAAHCTRNYDYGSVITPTTDTVIRYGAGFANSQKIAGGENVGWRELGSTDIGLYRVAQDVTLPALPKLYRSCNTVDLVGQRVVVYGRMVDGNQAPTADYYMSGERTIRGVVNGIGANGNYLQIDSTTDSGDSGGPWVFGGDRIVAATHSSSTGSDYGSRFCDVAGEIETQVKAWGDTLTFVEDLASGGAGGGDAGVNGQGGAGGSGVSSGGAGRSGGAGTTGPGAGGSSAGSSAGGAPITGGSGVATSGGASAGGSVVHTSLGGSGSGGKDSGAGGTSGADSSSGAGSGGTGRDTGGSGNAGTGGSDAAGSGGRASSQATGGSAIDTGGTGPARIDTRAATGTGGTVVQDSEPGATSTRQQADQAGCSCMTPGRGRRERSRESALLIVALGLVASYRRRSSPRRPGHGHVS
jgi:V8-like Glu-specific endopeptidase